jgi:hypothetical protein
VAIRDLQTGQHVECLNSGSNLMTPTTTQWCEVMNWVSGIKKTRSCCTVHPLRHMCVITPLGSPRF